jgi:transcriptional regulator with XRE-family HTH domain
MSRDKTLDVYRVIGANIAEAREQAGLTQQQLADKAGIHRVSLAAMEIGQRRFPIHKVEQLAKVLKIEVWDLLRKR